MSSTLTPGIEATPAGQYFADYSSISQSMLKVFMDRRRLYEAYYVTRTARPPEATDPMRKGTATHTALLEPERFEDLIVCYPSDILASNGAVSTKEAKAFRDEHQAAGRVVMKEADLSIVRSMASAIRSTCGNWIDQTELKEQTIHWTDEDTGLPCKMRFDWLVISKGGTPHFFDLKTTSDASPVAFRKQIEDRGYWLQDAHYRSGGEAAMGKPCEFHFVAVESAFPFAVGVYELDQKAMLDATTARRQVLTEVAECADKNNWREPWERTVQQLPLRPWTFNAHTL